jgi:hypothetical protein
MKKVILVFLLSLLLFSFNLIAQNVGIGTVTPQNTLHVFKGSAGAVTGWVDAPLIVENSTHSYINILAPDAMETGILFGKPASNVSGGIIYNSNSNLNGFQFRTNNNNTQMVLNSAGNLGIGIPTPIAKLHINVSGTNGYQGLAITNTNVGGKTLTINQGTPGKLNFTEPGILDLMSMDFTTGNVGIGTTDPANYKVKISYNNTNALVSTNGLDIENTSNEFNGEPVDWEIYTSPLNQGTGFGALEFFYNGSFVSEIGTNGQYQAESDERIKTNIKSMPAILDKIGQLRPSTYQFKDDKKGQEYNGFIAQDVMKIFPNLVTHNVDPRRKLDRYTMDYSGFGVLAIKGIQELQPIIEEQKEKIATLEERVNKLEAALSAITSTKNGNSSK